MAEKKRIVLIEDHALLRSVLVTRLGLEADFEVIALCASLAEAHEVALDEFDVAVVDIFLPDGDGTQLIREFHEAIPRSIPSLALTASADPKVHERALEAGASEVLTKNVGFEEVIEAIRRVAKAG